ncbi:predicted protein [Histoplasma mississippiense (nom. inval.)]|uniref:predicted protein n=1 Tax=Ajellomyces capsulatus (strain NAm1 / WU24) TaxID=2059318 RepID=UPI000157BF81|nr:predicted protein [Histoplasma mississippiense (nom. inval.)]EDN06805.1 predicted protein [Histoplasma mississippiense (nom. inval.)]
MATPALLVVETSCLNAEKTLAAQFGSRGSWEQNLNLPLNFLGLQFQNGNSRIRGEGKTRGGIAIGKITCQGYKNKSSSSFSKSVNTECDLEENSDDEFLASRLLFLATYDTDLDFDKLIDNNNLGEYINNHIYRHSKRFSKARKKKLDQMDELALSETLKLMFNITNFYPHRVDAFSPSIPHILKILSRIEIPTPPLQAPVNYLINSLLNLDLEAKKSKHFGTNPLFPKFDQNCNVDKLINILDQAVAMHKPQHLESLAVPLLTLLRKIYSFAPEGPKKYMEWLLLPEDNDHDLPIGKSNTLSSRLLRLSTSPVAPSLREGISALMFELSGSDATDFVRNVGYGFAAGFLMSHDMPVPETAKEAFSTSAGGLDPNLNPITGQRWDAEPQDGGPEMTEEEKEREAERLFILFERLKATGVVDVENPVSAALQTGRFEELG